MIVRLKLNCQSPQNTNVSIVSKYHIKQAIFPLCHLKHCGPPICLVMVNVVAI